MTEPIIERIAAAMLARLATISEANGYSADLAEPPSRPKRNPPITPKHRQIIVLQGTRTPVAGAQGWDTWLQPLQIHCLLRPADTDPTAADTHVNRLVSEVEKCLHADQSWATLAEHWEITGPDPLPEDLGLDGATLTVNVQYRHLHGDPYTGA